MKNASYLIIGLCLSFSGNLLSQVNIKPEFTDEKIEIDGVLSEGIWAKTVKYSDFKSYKPDFGKAFGDVTRVSMAYDKENLYVAFKCFDSEPGKIKATIASRDQIIDDDWVCINLDTRNEQQGINSFVVNPGGIQYDSYSSATTEDVSIDLVWYSSSKTDETGYCVEIRIPFKSIRYTNTDTVKMGVLFERRISRLTTHITFPSLDPAKGNAYLNQLAKIELTGIKHYNLFEVLPAVTYSLHKSRMNDILENDLNKPGLSLNLKYGITSGLILDATVNPDFSQIEADAGQVDINLRTQLYFPEKRPFFLEGNDKFSVAATGSSVVDPVYSMVYTRNIVDPISGLKLTGNIDQHNSVALLYAIDKIQVSSSGEFSYNHFPVFRYKHNFGSDNYFGVLYTGSQNKSGGNQAYGIDGQLRINPSTMLEYNGFNTHSEDTSSKSSGHSTGITLYSSKRKLDYCATLKDIGKDFNVTTGYYSRTGISQASLLLMPKTYFDSSLVRRIDFELFGSYTYDKIYSLGETYNHISALVLIGNTFQFKIKYSLSNEVFLGKRFNTGGFHVFLSGRSGKWMSAGILYRRINSIFYSSAPYGGLSNKLQASLEILPFPKLNLSLNSTYNDFCVKGTTTKVYRYGIERAKITYQINKFLFLRGIEEYNSYRKSMMFDFLLSFTYIPGTVFHAGYGSLIQQEDPGEPFFAGNIKPVETERGLFIKFSYLFRR
jgi:hypothetical protein